MFVLEEGEGFEGVVSSLHPPEKDIDRIFQAEDPLETMGDNPGEIREQKIMELDDQNYQDDHQESEEANQEELDYIE
jgi:hypothetical protein